MNFHQMFRVFTLQANIPLPGGGTPGRLHARGGQRQDEGQDWVRKVILWEWVNIANIFSMLVRNETVEGCRTRLGEDSVLSYFENLKTILLEWLIEKAGSLRDIKKICFGGTRLGMGKVSMANKF